jgi:hypothetical protein
MEDQEEEVLVAAVLAEVAVSGAVVPGDGKPDTIPPEF